MAGRDEKRRSGTGAKRRRPGGRNAEVREAVRRATLELLTHEGFGAVTLPAVARRAGVHKTTVYRGWTSRAALLQEALVELEALALPELDTGSFEGDVAAFVAARLRLIREPHAAAILRAVIGADDPDPTLYEWIEAFWKPRQQEWRSPIERAIERGELAPSARAVPLLEMVAGPLLLAQLATRRRVKRSEIESIAAILVAGVRALYGAANDSGDAIRASTIRSGAISPRRRRSARSRPTVSARD
ncbi:TetR/AcrR family transcriptional regulator [Myxococcota bacterium]|nr:TetR/AcrR family transcriptional regulator [Myxococcota bacterium]